MPNLTKRAKPAVSVAKRLRHAATAATPGINGKSGAKKRPLPSQQQPNQQSKKQKKRPDKVKPEEEITSESELDEPGDVAAAGSNHTATDLDNDADLLETPQEARVRLAQQLIGELKAREAERLGYGDEDDDDDDDEEDADLTGAVSARLQSANLRRAGRLRASLADAIADGADDAAGSVSSAKNWHRLAVTCAQLGADSLYTASKDGSVARWSLQAIVEGEHRHLRRVAHVPGGIRQRRRHPSKSSKSKPSASGDSANGGAVLHRGHVLCMALSSDQTRLATGDADGLVLVWQADTLQLVHEFRGHRAAITALAFRRQAPTGSKCGGGGGGLHLFSGSHDKTVRHWGLGGAPDCGLGFIEALFGHSAPVLGLDSMRLDRCISCGGPDKSLRLWKLAEESQLVFELPPGGGSNSCECVAMVTEQVFASGQGDGSLCLWSLQKKRPIARVSTAHGPDRWVTALAAVKNADLLASGSWDGLVRLWRLTAQPGSVSMSMSPLFQLPAPGFVNQLAFSPASADEDGGGGELLLAAGLGQEHKWGRWLVDKSARNVALVWRLALPTDA